MWWLCRLVHNHIGLVPLNFVICKLYDLSMLVWLPSQWASGFSGDHQQNHQCLWLSSCYNYNHVFCPSFLYSVGNKITTTTITTTTSITLLICDNDCDNAQLCILYHLLLSVIKLNDEPGLLLVLAMCCNRWLSLVKIRKNPVSLDQKMTFRGGGGGADISIRAAFVCASLFLFQRLLPETCPFCTAADDNAVNFIRGFTSDNQMRRNVCGNAPGHFPCDTIKAVSFRFQ